MMIAPSNKPARKCMIGPRLDSSVLGGVAGSVQQILFYSNLPSNDSSLIGGGSNLYRQLLTSKSSEGRVAEKFWLQEINPAVRQML